MNTSDDRSDGVSRRHILQILAPWASLALRPTSLAAQAVPVVSAGAFGGAASLLAGTFDESGSPWPEPPLQRNLDQLQAVRDLELPDQPRAGRRLPGEAVLVARPDDLLFLPAIRAGEAAAERGQVSPLELTEAYLARIAAIDPRERVHHRHRRAGAAGCPRGRAGDRCAATRSGPLHGIPYAPKDILATRGIRTTNGSKVTANWVPDTSPPSPSGWRAPARC